MQKTRTVQEGQIPAIGFFWMRCDLDLGPYHGILAGHRDHKLLIYHLITIIGPDTKVGQIYRNKQMHIPIYTRLLHVLP